MPRAKSSADRAARTLVERWLVGIWNIGSFAAPSGQRGIVARWFHRSLLEKLSKSSASRHEDAYASNLLVLSNWQDVNMVDTFSQLTSQLPPPSATRKPPAEFIGERQHRPSQGHVLGAPSLTYARLPKPTHHQEVGCIHLVLARAVACADSTKERFLVV
jgi:hypothetical protein